MSEKFLMSWSENVTELADIFCALEYSWSYNIDSVFEVNTAFPNKESYANYVSSLEDKEWCLFVFKASGFKSFSLENLFSIFGDRASEDCVKARAAFEALLKERELEMKKYDASSFRMYLTYKDSGIGFINIASFAEFYRAYITLQNYEYYDSSVFLNYLRATCNSLLDN